MAALGFNADPFAALGLQRDASPRAIRARYYQLARKYHPNRNHGPEEAQKALAERFHRVHDAWSILSKDSQRRRFIEWLQLAELESKVEAHRLDLEYIDNGDSASDGWSSDDDDFDLTHLSKIKRARSPAPDTSSNSTGTSTPRSNTLPHDSDNTHPRNDEPRGRGPERRITFPATERLKQQDKREGSDVQTAAMRRKRLGRMKRKELEAFEEYRDAKLTEIHAQIKAERLKEYYERAKARREKVEKMPRETATRIKLVQKINMAVSLLQAQAPRRPHRPTISTGANLTANDGDFTSLSSPISARSGLMAHRRGWSSDISGDQTDSDEEPAPHVHHIRKPSRSPTPLGRPRLPPPRQPSPVPSPPLTLHPFNGNPPPRPDSKLRILVKRPTGFEDSNDPLGHDSHFDDPTTPTARSPSPPLLSTSRALVRLDPEAMDLNLFDDHPHHAIGSDTLHHSSDDSDSDISRPPGQGFKFEVKTIGALRFPVHIPFDHVHKLDIFEESRLLGTPLDKNANPEHLLKRLHSLDPVVASRFMIKPDIKDSFAFRLICSNREFVRQTHRSFIALSYRRKKVVEKHGNAFTLPLSKEMLQAVWEERISDDEGLWIDQCCIKQDDDFEKTVSMSAMDLVYRGARLIVVVLDDIELKQHESEVLEHHMEEYMRLKHVAPNRRFRRHQPPWLETHDDLFQVISKVLTASWFRRAWCRHEMRLARDHVFLIPCHTVGSFRTTILRITSPCFTHLLALATEVPFEAHIEQIKPSLHAFFRDRSTQSSSHDAELRSHHGNFTTVAAEVFGMEAGGDPKVPESQREADARWDKMSIILNAMECGLTLQSTLRLSRLSLTKEDCYYTLLVLALAARDPGALCSVGKPILLTQPTGFMQPMTSWLFEPTVVDAGLNTYRTLRRMSADCPIQTGISRGAHWVQLDLKFLRSGGIRTVAQTADDSQDVLEIAEDFVRKCEERKWGRHRRRYLINDLKANEKFGSMRDLYIETLTCVFCCGPDWLTSICHRYGVGRWKQDLQQAIWLLVSLRNMYGKWPVLPKSDDWTARAAGFLMDFVNFLVIRGMPQRQLKAPERWKPVWVSTPNHGKILSFSPAHAGIVPVIPTVLLDADYLHLARLWILEPRTTADKWTLLGKSVLFSDELAMYALHHEDDLVRPQQKVYGRPVS